MLTSGIGNLDTMRISNLCAQIHGLRERGIEVVLVSSGAIGLGMGKLALKERPKDLAKLQACAAIGQSILINTWQAGFDPHGLTVAQVLLTREDLRGRARHNAVFGTVECLLAQGVIPIVNENDTVSAAEIKFGDNDTLSALVASVINADTLFILSNIPGLIDKKGSGEVVHHVEKITPEIEAMAEGTSQTTSVGGMVSKLSAAKIAHRTGCGVVIGSGQDPELFQKLLKGETIGSYFVPSEEPVRSHKRWIAIQDHNHGTLIVDPGASEAILHQGKSLLSAGITHIEGNFEAGDVVQIATDKGEAIAQGTSELDAQEAQLILGLTTTEAKDRLPDRNSSVVVHRDNLVLLD